MGRTNQGGSVLSFVIVGILLAGLLVGGVYIVNRQTVGQPVAPVEQKPQKEMPDGSQSPPPAKPGNNSQQPDPFSNIPQAGTGTANTGAAELPATGSRETFGSLLIIGLLGGVVVGYVRSRRPQLSL